jgi:hypothetical protein
MHHRFPAVVLVFLVLAASTAERALADAQSPPLKLPVASLNQPMISG